MPIEAVLAIYAKENGQGMMFNEGDQNTLPPNPDKPDPDKPDQIKPAAKRSHLKIVK